MSGEPIWNQRYVSFLSYTKTRKIFKLELCVEVPLLDLRCLKHYQPHMTISEHGRSSMLRFIPCIMHTSGMAMWNIYVGGCSRRSATWRLIPVHPQLAIYQNTHNTDNRLFPLILPLKLTCAVIAEVCLICVLTRVGWEVLVYCAPCRFTSMAFARDNYC